MDIELVQENHRDGVTHRSAAHHSFSIWKRISNQIIKSPIFTEQLQHVTATNGLFFRIHGVSAKAAKQQGIVSATEIVTSLSLRVVKLVETNPGYQTGKGAMLAIYATNG